MAVIPFASLRHLGSEGGHDRVSTLLFRSRRARSSQGSCDSFERLSLLSSALRPFASRHFVGFGGSPTTTKGAQKFGSAHPGCCACRSWPAWISAVPRRATGWDRRQSPQRCRPSARRHLGCQPPNATPEASGRQRRRRRARALTAPRRRACLLRRYCRPIESPSRRRA